MKPFIVSARKYRPQTFDDVVGQSAITQTLENAIANNHLAQALLFTGPRGVGKTTCARILAKKINQQDNNGDSDNDFAFNIFELDAASNNSVDDIRGLTDQVRIPPQVGSFKVYIIDEVHMLSQSAFNAFLKTLEEPPAHAIFILATTEKHKIIPTILSRCQIFDFKRITVTAMREHLKRIAQHENIIADDEALHIIAQKADGALRDALSIFDRVVSFSGTNLTVKAVTENLNVLDRDTYFKFTDLIIDNNIPELLLAYDNIMSQGFDGHHFIAGLASHFRDLMVCKDQRTIALIEASESAKEKYSTQCNKVDLTYLRHAIHLSNDADFNYRSSRNPRLHIELCLMQLASIQIDAQKKNDVSKIIAATNFTTKSTPSPSKLTKQSNEPTQSIATVQPISIDNKTTPSNQEANLTTTITPDHQSSQVKSPNLEQARKALDAKRKKQVSSLSLKGFDIKKDHVVNKIESPITNDQLPVEPITQEQLRDAWSTYAQHIRERGQLILAAILDADQPTLQNDHTIVLRYPNTSMKEDLEKSQVQVLNHIKSELKNYSLELEIHVDQTVEKKYVFTDQEKLTTLIDKNPSINLLRQRFNLDL